MWYEGNLEHFREVSDETRKFFEDNEHIVPNYKIEEPQVLKMIPSILWTIPRCPI